MFVKKSPHDRLPGFANFVGMTLLAVHFPLQPPNCFLKVCVPEIFAAILKFFVPLTHYQPQFLTQQIPKSKHLRVLQLERLYYPQMESQFSLKNVRVHRVPDHVVDQYLYRMESLLVLKQQSCSVF